MKSSEPCKGKNGKATNFHAARLRKADERTLAEQVGQARSQLPDEVPELAAGAAMVLRYAGLPVTRGSVRARLKATGRDRASLEAEMARESA